MAPKNLKQFSVYFILGPIVLLALMAIFIGISIFKGANHRVILVNALHVPYDVSIGGRDYSMNAVSRKELRLGEGTWDVVPSGKNVKELQPSTLEIKTSFFTRPFANPIFVVNPDRMGVFVQETAHYAAKAADAPEGNSELLAGKPTYEFPSVDFVFEPLPDQLKIEGGSTAKRVRLGQEMFENSDLPKVLSVAMDPNLGIDPLDYLESRVEHFGDADILVSILAKMAPSKRFVEFVSKHLEVVPIRINLHREYQNALRNDNQLETLLTKYGERLKGAPKSPEWIYLLARITEDEIQADALWNQLYRNREVPDSVRTGCVSRLMSIGQFQEASRLAYQISSQAQGQPAITMLTLSVWEAAQDYDGVLRRCQFVRDPFAGAARMYGVRATHAKNESNSEQATTAFIKQLLSTAGIPAGATIDLVDDKEQTVLKAYAAYANRDLAKFESLSSNVPEIDEFDLVSVSGDFAPYTKSDSASDEGKLSWTQSAILALTAHKKGDTSARDSFIADCVQALEVGDYFERKISKWLASKEKIDAKAIRNIPISPREKSMVTALLFLKHPDQAEELKQLVNLFNFEKSPPYWLLNDIVNSKP